MGKPGKDNIKNIASHIKRPVDVFICSASYEDRCKSIPNQLTPDYFQQVLICENEDLKDVIAPNSNYLRQRFGNKAVSVYLETANPLKSADNFKKALLQTLEYKAEKYLIDITTFTHESLLILLKILQDNLDIKKTVQFVYTSAAEYAVGMDVKDKWLSKGIGEIRSILGYPGLLLPSRKVHLIVLVGFESERAAKLIDEYEPASVSLGFGKAEDSINIRHHEANLVFHNMLSMKYGNVMDFTFSCIDPFETKQVIIEQIAKKPGYNVVIAAMNTKISTIGAALVAFEDEKIQLCYAHANQYNVESYSLPGEECFIFDLQ